MPAFMKRIAVGLMLVGMACAQEAKYFRLGNAADAGAPLGGTCRPCGARMLGGVSQGWRLGLGTKSPLRGSGEGCGFRASSADGRGCPPPPPAGDAGATKSVRR